MNQIDRNCGRSGRWFVQGLDTMLIGMRRKQFQRLLQPPVCGTYNCIHNWTTVCVMKCEKKKKGTKRESIVAMQCIHFNSVL